MIRTFIVDATEKQLFPIDFYKDSAELTDLEVSVSVNGSRKTLTTDYTLETGTKNKYVKFNTALEVDDQIVLAPVLAVGRGVVTLLHCNKLLRPRGKISAGGVSGAMRNGHVYVVG